ncbi:hypothetical protein JY651_01145 [Pyxidicoccus parkwayensis]|uniref:Uncharacterized protein n=1 Tax=Pyxidicoccus parkwayensis TaxID=2813578 RepID=A0ABX7NXJ7_9BACT|nr:hypothetical protein [Pyxidicoccus parkwaysis]QSQ23622.1 hypothetical protein JY651_01145 [Pyxidicoccus parkwaysis]
MPVDFTKEKHVRRLATALRRLLKQRSVLVLDIEWLLLRCQDTLAYEGNLRQASAEQLGKDVASFEEEFPGLLPET